MDRNAPCPCGSGRKYKKCHGAAVPPEVAALPADARAEWLRGDAVLARQRRVGQELLDWAERKLDAAWVDAALDAWGVHEEEDIDDALADLFTAWSLFTYSPPSLAMPIAAAWLDDAAGRKADADTRALVMASRFPALGFWQVETVEAGVGATITDRLSDTTCFVHEPSLTHDLEHGDFMLTYVTAIDGVHVLAGFHGDPLLFTDGKALLARVLDEAGVAEGQLTREQQSDAKWQIRVARQWTDTVISTYDDEDGQEDGRDDEHQGPA
ncbi:MAG TPA: SEC-C domain-containing protein [Gemmatimonas sp.]|nr:SEC-C domain-containing protein [Gemmatimonas sp.]